MWRSEKTAKPSGELSFEEPLVAIERELAQLRKMQTTGVDFTTEITRLESKAQSLARQIYSKLTPLQVFQLSRHPRRPTGRNLLAGLCDDFTELRGDRIQADDWSVCVGVGRLDDQPLAVASASESTGAVTAAGIRKIGRIATLAKRFGLPLLTVLAGTAAVADDDAACSIAVGDAAVELTAVEQPTVSLVVGAASGLFAGLMTSTDSTLMCQYATLLVAPLERVAERFFNAPDKPPRYQEAAKAMGVMADTAKKIGLVDMVLEEPRGGAHRDSKAAMEIIKRAVGQKLDELASVAPLERIAARNAGFWS
jgi:acetyl-CoA carboxylase carboxyl transferase subunit alpha